MLKKSSSQEPLG